MGMTLDQRNQLTTFLGETMGVVGMKYQIAHGPYPESPRGPQGRVHRIVPPEDPGSWGQWLSWNAAVRYEEVDGRRQPDELVGLSRFVGAERLEALIGAFAAAPQARRGLTVE